MSDHDLTQPENIDEADKTQVLMPEQPPLPLLGFLVRIKGSVNRFVELDKENMIFGRGSNCEVKISDKAISRQHARIRLVTEEDQAPHFVIFDLGSGNGTTVNGEKIIKHQLQDGDYIILGETELVFKQIQLQNKSASA